MCSLRCRYPNHERFAEKSLYFPPSLRSKRSGAKERNSGHAKAWKWKEGGGGGERRERLPANPLILKNAH